MEFIHSERTRKAFLITDSGLAYQAQLDPEVIRRKGYRFQSVHFEHPHKNAPKMTGEHHVLSPYTAANPTFVGAESTTDCQILWGSALILSVGPDGEIIETHLTDSDEMSGFFVKNWLFTFIAENRGATILEATSSKGKNARKQLVEPGTLRIGQKDIPPTYWELHRRYTTPPSKP